MFPYGTLTNKLCNSYFPKYKKKTRVQGEILILSILIHSSWLSASHLIRGQHWPCLSNLGLDNQGLRLMWRLYLRQWLLPGIRSKEEMETDSKIQEKIKANIFFLWFKISALPTLTLELSDFNSTMSLHRLFWPTCTNLLADPHGLQTHSHLWACAMIIHSAWNHILPDIYMTHAFTSLESLLKDHILRDNFLCHLIKNNHSAWLLTPSDILIHCLSLLGIYLTWI